MKKNCLKQIVLLFLIVSLIYPSMSFANHHNKIHWVDIGEGTFDQGFLFPYKVKLAIPFGERNISDIKSGLIAIRFQLDWLLMEASKDQVQKIFNTQIRDNFSDIENFNLSKNMITSFLKKLPSVNKKNQWVFEYDPDEGTILYIEDKKIHHIIGAELNHALLESWINKNPVLTNNLFTRLLKLQ